MSGWPKELSGDMEDTLAGAQKAHLLRLYIFVFEEPYKRMPLKKDNKVEVVMVGGFLYARLLLPVR